MLCLDRNFIHMLSHTLLPGDIKSGKKYMYYYKAPNYSTALNQQQRRLYLSV